MFDPAFPTQFLRQSRSGMMGLYTQYISDPVIDTTFAKTFGIIASAAMCVLLMLPTATFEKRKDGSRIPPGPRGWPVVGKFQVCLSHGNILMGLTQLLGSFFSLTHYPELVLDKWAKAFGKIYSVWLGNQFFVIVSEASIAKDLMVTNGNVFSSRKEMFVKSQKIFAGRGITATPYNNIWQALKRME